MKCNGKDEWICRWVWIDIDYIKQWNESPTVFETYIQFKVKIKR